MRYIMNVLSPAVHLSLLINTTQLYPHFLQAIYLFSISSTYIESICEGDEGGHSILYPLIKDWPIVNTLKITRKCLLHLIILKLHCEKYILLEYDHRYITSQRSASHNFRLVFWNVFHLVSNRVARSLTTNSNHAKITDTLVLGLYEVLS